MIDKKERVVSSFSIPVAEGIICTAEWWKDVFVAVGSNLKSCFVEQVSAVKILYEG